MIDRLYGLARPMAFALDPERAHELALRLLEIGPLLRQSWQPDQRLAVEVFGKHFNNPIGLAAGFDKDARVPDAVLGLGFSHVEIGSVTPSPQAGNPRPRVFRLSGDRAIINRMGFNSAGHAAVAKRLAARKNRGGIVGVNLGANRASADRAADFVSGIEQLGEYASYLTINISSPNTPGLRDLQLPKALSELMARLIAARGRLQARTGQAPPLIVKLAPEIAEDDLAEMVNRLLAGGADGIAISNTTLARDGLSETALAQEAGGLSGPPLFRRSNRMLARIYQLTQGKLPLIGLGGVDSGAAAAAKIAAGASLVQVYTGIVYEGPGLARSINSQLVSELDHRGLSSISALRGMDSERWAHGAL